MLGKSYWKGGMVSRPAEEEDRRFARLRQAHWQAGRSGVRERVGKGASDLSHGECVAMLQARRLQSPVQEPSKGLQHPISMGGDGGTQQRGVIWSKKDQKAI